MNSLSIQNNDNNKGMGETQSRQLAEMQSKIFLAKQFPRNIEDAKTRIFAECESVKIAESAIYSYPRGKEEVRGPSIRLAEVIARNWGNFQCGVTEVEQNENSSVVKAYAWDMETNMSDEKIFTVVHERHTKKGTYKLTDPRDIYELAANQGARRKRACILALIPNDIVIEAMDRCEKTLEQHYNGKDISEIWNDIVESFKKYIPDDTEALLERKLEKSADEVTRKDVEHLRYLYAAIRDGMIKPEIAFGIESDIDNYIDDDANDMLKELNEEISEAGKEITNGANER